MVIYLINFLTDFVVEIAHASMRYAWSIYSVYRNFVLLNWSLPSGALYPWYSASDKGQYNALIFSKSNVLTVLLGMYLIDALLIALQGGNAVYTQSPLFMQQSNNLYSISI